MECSPRTGRVAVHRRVHMSGIDPSSYVLPAWPADQEASGPLTGIGVSH